MTFGSRSVAAAAIALTTATLSGAPQQAATSTKPTMVEDVFKNVQILKGIPVDEFMGTMGFFSAALGMNCTDCHVDESGGDWAKYADDNPKKRTARRMMEMVTALNRTSLLVLDAHDLHALMARQPQIAERIREVARVRLEEQGASTQGDLLTEELEGRDEL